MRLATDLLWTRLLPDSQHVIDTEAWFRHGGKWIIFDRKDPILRLAERLAPYIDSGEIEGAKYWNRDPGAICVYSLDRDREKTLEILRRLGAGTNRVWEYDYAWDKNLRSPITFLYSWYSKLSTILRSYGVFGTLRLIREVLRESLR